MKPALLIAGLPLLAGLVSAPALAATAQHTVTFTVPVNISAMPYIKGFTVGCNLTYPDGTVLTGAQSGAAFSRYDGPVSGGEFHGSVPITITAADGPAPTGYACELYVTPSDDSGAFKPQPSTQTLVPAQHRAAAGPPLVTEVSGGFGGKPAQLAPSGVQRALPPLTLPPAR